MIPTTPKDERVEVVLDMLEAVVRRFCYTDPGKVHLTMALRNQPEGDALRMLAKNGRFRLHHDSLTAVTGFWPEYEPGSAGLRRGEPEGREGS